MTTQAIRQALRTKYCAPEWALLEEVRHRAPDGGERSADAIATNLWQSNNYKIVGFEIKSSRSDWLREIKDPSKADVISSMCDEWVIVTAPGIVQTDELPEAWGLMELKGNGLHTKVKPPKLSAPKAITRNFLASLLRRAVTVGEQEVAAAILDAKRQAQDDARKWAEEEAKRRARAHTELITKLEKVKAQTGIDLSDWQVSEESISAAIRFGLAEGRAGITERYNGLLQVQSQMRRLDKAIADLGPLAQEQAIPRKAS